MALRPGYADAQVNLAMLAKQETEAKKKSGAKKVAEGKAPAKKVPAKQPLVTKAVKKPAAKKTVAKPRAKSKIKAR
jgi:DNA topoisomerase I